MKRTIFAGVIFLVVISFLTALANSDVPKFNKQEREKLELIKKAKVFGESLGLHPTRNFLEFRERLSKYNLLFYSKKTDVPFCYIDPLMLALQSDFDNATDSVKNYGIATDVYDVFFSQVAMSSGTYTTRSFLTYSNRAIARTVLHEDLHGNTDLPRELQEAIAEVFETAAASRFFKDDDKEFRSAMAFSLVEALILDELFHKIEAMHEEFKKGNIATATYLQMRDKEIGDSWYGSMTAISVLHTYKHYHALVYRLLKAMDYDLPRFIVFFREFPFHGPRRDMEQEQYFAETLRIEKDAEVYLEDAIASLTGPEIGNPASVSRSIAWKSPVPPGFKPRQVIPPILYMNGPLRLSH